MTDSILNSVKKNLGLDANYKVFDPDIIMHTNSVFGTLHQLGVGPLGGFQIEDESNTWAEFTDNLVLLNPVKSYITLQVRMMFDPPTTSFHLEAIKEQIREFEWRISIQREESVVWAPPAPLSS